MARRNPETQLTSPSPTKKPCKTPAPTLTDDDAPPELATPVLNSVDAGPLPTLETGLNAKFAEQPEPKTPNTANGNPLETPRTNSSASNKAAAFKSLFASKNTLDASGCRVLELTPVVFEYTQADRLGQSELSFVVDDAGFTSEMKAKTAVLGIKKFDHEAFKWTEVVPGKTNALTSCKMSAPDGTKPFRYYILSVTLLGRYKNDIDRLLAEVNAVLKPHKYVLKLTPAGRALVPVTLTFTSMPSGKMRSNGVHDVFLRNLIDITECGLEQVQDADNNSFLQTVIVIAPQEYITGLGFYLRAEGVENVSVKVVAP
jgi:hypothetical protein